MANSALPIMTIAATGRVIAAGGSPASVWRGTTVDGREVTALIVAVNYDGVAFDFDAGGMDAFSPPPAAGSAQ
jgi:hypothetical protein